MAYQKRFIYTNTIPEATKINSAVPYGERFQTIKSHNHLNKWLREVTLQIKTLNLIYLNTYCHQTCQGDELLRGAPTLTHMTL